MEPDIQRAAKDAMPQEGSLDNSTTLSQSPHLHVLSHTAIDSEVSSSRNGCGASSFESVIASKSAGTRGTIGAGALQKRPSVLEHGSRR